MKLFENKGLLKHIKKWISAEADLAVSAVVVQPSRFRTILFDNRSSKFLLFPVCCFKVDMYRIRTGFKFHELKFGLLRNEFAKTVYAHKFLTNISCFDGGVCMHYYYNRRKEHYADELADDAINYFWNSAFFEFNIKSWQETNLDGFFEDTAKIGRIPPDSKQIFPRRWVTRR